MELAISRKKNLRLILRATHPFAEVSSEMNSNLGRAVIFSSACSRDIVINIDDVPTPNPCKRLMAPNEIADLNKTFLHAAYNKNDIQCTYTERCNPAEKSYVSSLWKWCKSVFSSPKKKIISSTDPDEMVFKIETDLGQHSSAINIC
ncbi:hypothetical protein NPIL_217011 [Nephila pilipes]|uniref:Uncharacterized protein n=1 Tax=Nephila pilipes TaxID=299642 RepID=A0A8X6T2Z6_NEPPI|nr:hypothetical protein NPIL_217011 [Nephila pilipes]